MERLALEGRRTVRDVVIANEYGWTYGRR